MLTTPIAASATNQTTITGPEADAGGAVTLQRVQRDQHDDGERHDVLLQARRGHFQASIAPSTKWRG
jgi:hypothetical protein